MDTARSSETDHPYESVLPPLALEEFEALRAEIEACGEVRVPIEVDERGRILDGHHRERIARELGIEAPRRVVPGLASDAERRAYAIRANLVRRNLSPSQKADLRDTQRDLAKRLREAGRSQTQIARLLGVAQQTVSDWLGSDTTSGKASVSVQIEKEARPAIVARVAAGESRRQVAADYAVTPRRIGQIVEAKPKKASSVATRLTAIAEQMDCLSRDLESGKAAVETMTHWSSRIVRLTTALERLKKSAP